MNNELFHYGVLGMRWGVRRNTSESSVPPKRKMSADAEEMKRLQKKPLNQMSNQELQRYNQRTQLENIYRRANPSNFKKSIAIATTAAAAMGTVASLYTNSGKMIQIGKSVAEKMSEIPMSAYDPKWLL